MPDLTDVELASLDEYLSRFTAETATQARSVIAEVRRSRPVVAAVDPWRDSWRHSGGPSWGADQQLIDAVDAYRAARAALEGESK